jgi:glycosyltransferase involved in cell wall biosynthesis
MRALFLHDNFPGQFRHLAAALAADPANEVVFGTKRKDDRQLPGVMKALYEPTRSSGPATHAYLRRTEDAVLSGQAVARMVRQLGRRGFDPDVVVAHSGWGAGLFVPEVLPEARLLTYIEWYYRAHGSNLDFLPDDPLSTDEELRARVNNLPFLHDLVNCDRALMPTEYQRAQLPAVLRPKATVIHEGVDTERLVPARGAPLVLPGLDLRGVDEIVTYATRGMEPYRGFPTFMRAVARLLQHRPRTHVVIAGEDRVAYGPQLEPGDSWKARMLAECDLDLARVHFVGSLPFDQYVRVLQASSVHVYLTVPFVLSWSLLEAMSVGALVVASHTAPVLEVMAHGRNGLLTDFFDHEALAAWLHEVLEHPDRYEPLRAAARQTIVERYDLRLVLPRQIRLVTELAVASR